MFTARYRPYVIMNAAMTLDGKIATKSNDSKISSKLDLIRVHKLRATVDAILVGINTVLIDNPRLTARYGGKNPVRVIVDSKSRIRLGARVMHSCKTIPTIVASSETAPKSKIARIRSLGADVVVCGKKRVNLERLLMLLKKKGISRLLVEGGGEINWSMLRNGLVDEVMVTISPRIVGGRDAVTLVEGDGFAKIDNGIKLKLVKVRKLGNELILFYRPIN